MDVRLPLLLPALGAGGPSELFVVAALSIAIACLFGRSFLPAVLLVECFAMVASPVEVSCGEWSLFKWYVDK